MGEPAESPTKTEKRLLPVLIHIFPSQDEALDKLHLRLGRSKSDLIREAVTVLLANYKVEDDNGKTILD